MAQSYMYVGGAAIHVFDMNVDTGSISEIGSPVQQDGAGGFMAPSADGAMLYTTAAPGAAAFKIDLGTGSLQHTNTIKCDIAGNSHVAVTAGSDGGVALLAAYGGGGINVVKILPDGRLAEVETGVAVQHEGGSGAYQPGDAQAKPHPHSCFIDPNGKWALVSDLGQDKVYVYAIDVSAGKLTEHAVVSTAPGAGPRHLCFHPNGRQVFGINELDCTINVYAWDSTSGALGPILQTVSTLPEGYNNRDHENAKNADAGPASGPNRPGQTNACADIHVTPDGNFLYGSNRGHDSLVSFSIAEDGKLTLGSFTYTRGMHPRNFGIHPSGNWIVVANQDSNNVVVFGLNKRTGDLTPTTFEASVKKARCIKWVSSAAPGDC